ncbi:MAG: hypothetical protein L0Z62_05295 [Gemmataceae bacterium]|nr:hypothetical protein [Gemmataceae bacterium]
MEHTFHTRHDFTPELGWAAFQLLAEFGAEGTTLEGLEQTARTLASPMTRRSDLGKLLRSMDELGLLGKATDRLSLSVAGRALAASAGRYEPGFCAGIHCLYAWNWLWGRREELATPSWSYRQVCREIRTAGPLGIEPDAIVLKVAAAGERFGAERVSFSRSSVNGVTAWLKAHSPPLVGQAGARLHALPHLRPGPTTVRFHVAALCALHGGEARVHGENAELLADGLLLPSQELSLVLEESLGNSQEFHLFGGHAKRIAYHGSTDSFLEWIVHGRQSDNQATSGNSREGAA